MKLFVITALLLPAICLATTSEDDMLAQLLAMKASGTKHNAAAEYTYDSSKGAVVSILELVKEMIDTKATAAAKLVKDIADADQLVIDNAAKTKTAKEAQTTAQGALDDAKEAYTTADGEQGKAQTAADTLKNAQPAAEAAAEKSGKALCGIVNFLCKNTTDATKPTCTRVMEKGDCVPPTAAPTAAPTVPPACVFGRNERPCALPPSGCGVLVFYQKTCESQGFKRITSKEDCKAIQELLVITADEKQKKFTISRTLIPVNSRNSQPDAYPAGCYQKYDSVYWNERTDFEVKGSLATNDLERPSVCGSL